MSSGGDDGGLYLIGAVCLLIYGAGYVVVSIAKAHAAVLKVAFLALFWGSGAVMVLGVVGGFVWVGFLRDWYKHRKAVSAIKRERQERERQEHQRIGETKKKMISATERSDEAINEIKKQWSD